MIFDPRFPNSNLKTAIFCFTLTGLPCGIIWELIGKHGIIHAGHLFTTHYFSTSIPRQYCQVKYVRGEKIRKEITSLWCRLINSTSSTTTVTQWSQSLFEVTYTIRIGLKEFYKWALIILSRKSDPQILTHTHIPPTLPHVSNFTYLCVCTFWFVFDPYPSLIFRRVLMTVPS